MLMDVILGLDKADIKRPTIVTVGTFDGVHLGHQQIIKELIYLSKKHDLLPMLVTFEPHPKYVVNSGHKVPLKILSDLHEKLDVFKKLGLQKVIVIEFTEEFSEMDYQSFLKDVLLTRLKAEFIIIGYDHAFGVKRAGTFRELNDFKNQYGFKLKQIHSIGLNGDIISSSIIRDYINKGQISIANKMLGRPYSLSGIVVKGEGRGKTLLFPTANIRIINNNKLIPKEGVYAVDCLVENRNYHGMANIGYKPTFGSSGKSVEAHIFDFKENIYNKELKLFFLKRLRNEKKFNNQKELMKQLKIDKKNSYL